MTDPLERQRALLPDGYEIVPVGLLEMLAAAALAAYDPAFGGDASAVRHAGVAASNVLARYRARKNDSQPRACRTCARLDEGVLCRGCLDHNLWRDRGEA